eukprot:4588462-Prymnesium_polylepis.1
MFLGKLDGSGIGGTDAHSAPTSDASGIDERSARLETPAAPSTVASAWCAQEGGAHGGLRWPTVAYGGLR